MNAETVDVFAIPVESQLENFMELSDVGIAGDRQSPPDQWAERVFEKFHAGTRRLSISRMVAMSRSVSDVRTRYS